MKKNSIYTDITYLFFLFLPFIDLITALMERFSYNFLSIGIIFKTLFIVYLLGYIIFISKSQYRKQSLFYIALLVLFGLIFIITKKTFTLSNLTTEFKMLLKYFYLPISFIGLVNIYSENKLAKNQIINVFLFTLLCYSLILLIPLITKTAFNTYSKDTLSGKIGWFYSANEVSAIMLILLPFAFLLINSDKKFKWLYLLIFPIIYVILNIGTKVSFLGTILIILFFFICQLIKNKKIKTISNYIFLSLLAFTILAGCITPTLKNLINKEHNKVETMCYEPPYKFEKLKIYDYKYYHQINMIFSGREVKVEKFLNIYNKSNLTNKMFGLGFTNHHNINDTFIKNTIEIDILDIFFHYGIIGLLIVFLPIIYMIYKLWQNKKKVNYLEFIGYSFIILLLLGVASLAGHVLSSATICIYLSLLLILLLGSSNVLPIKNKDYNLVKETKRIVKYLFKIYHKNREIINYLIVWVCAVVFAYFANRIFVFNSHNKNKLKEFASFTSSRIITLLMDMATMFLCVTIFKINDLIAKLIVQVIVTIANYIFSKLFVFKQK